MPNTVDEHEAKCPCGLDGLDDHLPDISGSDTLQALMLAARLLANRLIDFKEKGGRIVHPGRDEPVGLSQDVTTSAYVLRARRDFRRSKSSRSSAENTGLESECIWSGIEASGRGVGRSACRHTSDPPGQRGCVDATSIKMWETCSRTQDNAWNLLTSRILDSPCGQVGKKFNVVNGLRRL